jgi:hypothetical protein
MDDGEDASFATTGLASSTTFLDMWYAGTLGIERWKILHWCIMECTAACIECIWSTLSANSYADTSTSATEVTTVVFWFITDWTHKKLRCSVENVKVLAMNTARQEKISPATATSMTEMEINGSASWSWTILRGAIHPWAIHHRS